MSPGWFDTDKGEINGITVYGALRHQTNAANQGFFTGDLRVGDNDAPKLVQAMAIDDAPLIFTGPAIQDGKTTPIRIPVLIRIRMGTVSTVVEVASAGPPIALP